MNLEILEATHFEKLLLAKTAFIDVRAPIEFYQGALPNSTNLPILNDEERAKVGTEYKLNGPEAANVLGHLLVSGKERDQRIQDWENFIRSNPTCILYCFRGGKRSQITQAWLQERGVHLARLDGGYKNVRQFLLERLNHFSETQNILPLAGPTGSGKTILIGELKDLYPTIDLEDLARHRGSAFGAKTMPQPTQIDFENHLAVEMMKIEKSLNLDVLRPNILPLVEDESRMIGRCVLPNIFFEKINSSPVILIDEDIEVRVQNIFQDYILDSPINSGHEENALVVFEKYRKSLLAISKKLGGLRTQEVLGLLNLSEAQFRLNGELESNRAWIETLLVYYYDPLYLSSLDRRKVGVIFRGTRSECYSYLIERKP